MNNGTLTYYSSEGYSIVAPDKFFGRSSVLESGEVLYNGGYRAVAPSEIYGAESHLASVDAADVVTPMLSSEPMFHLLLFASLVVYLHILYRSSHFLGSIYRDMFTMRSERSLISQGGLLPLQRFKQIAAVMGFVTLALVVVRYAECMVPSDAHIYSSGIVGYMPLLTMLIVLVYLAWYYALHVVADWVTRSDVASTLASVGYMYFVRMTVVLYPLVAVWLLGAESAGVVVVPLLLVVLCLMLIFYLKDTILLFIAKKISILYWILYLCTAFLLPVSFMIRLLPERLG
ncbi:MAG: DUF4271 domain-containing protein [Alistipes sp.]|nr:DUF4271 domain-containing protein [Alistipes sp.]